MLTVQQAFYLVPPVSHHMASQTLLQISLDPSAFRPHVYTEDGVQTLYHVYDNLSQTPYIDQHGIEAGDPNTYVMHPQHIITYSAMLSHLNWRNREPTYFISLYGNKQAALQEAYRRRQKINVPGVSSVRDPTSVRITVVSVQVLDQEKIFYFSRAEMINMLQVPAAHIIFTSSTPEEWFVMEYIPHAAITAII